MKQVSLEAEYPREKINKSGESNSRFIKEKM